MKAFLFDRFVDLACFLVLVLSAGLLIVLWPFGRLAQAMSKALDWAFEQLGEAPE